MPRCRCRGCRSRMSGTRPAGRSAARLIERWRSLQQRPTAASGTQADILFEGGTNVASRGIRRGRPGQRGGRQAPGLDAGLAREAHGGHRAAVRRRVLPQHRLPAEQERHPRRQGRQLLPPRRRVRDRHRRLEGRHGRRPRPQAEDGRRAGRDAPREVPGERRRARHGPRALRRAEDDRGRAQRGRDPDAPRPDRRHRHRVARPDRRHPRPRGVAAR